jgi:hypothetical protein
LQRILGIGLVTFLTAACSLWDNAPPPEQTRSVNFYLEPSSAALPAGETVDVVVRFDATVTPVAAVQAYLNFDPAVLQVIDDSGSPATRVVPGQLFSAADWQILQNAVNNSTGQVDFAGGKKPMTGTDVAENSSFAALRFRALKPISNTTVSFNSPDSANLRQTKAASGFQDVTGKLDGLTISIGP